MESSREALIAALRLFVIWRVKVTAGVAEALESPMVQR
jgi:hypothetical protein